MLSILGLYLNYVFVSFTKVSSSDYLNSQNKEEKTKINYILTYVFLVNQKNEKKTFQTMNNIDRFIYIYM